ncbi:MAG: DNA adenine methyltransferase YhdJ [candidate division WS2 bacterium]|nr:DNA adenine methyltransferase YhdJ [Candidatus Lithacetigena glycinireducens]
MFEQVKEQLSDEIFYQEDDGILVLSDCLKILPLIPDETISLIVTSPPYWNIHKYNNGNEIGYGQSLDEYIFSMENVFKQFHRILKQSGNVIFNIMDVQRSNNLVRLSDLIIDISPLKLRQRIIWYIPNKMPVVNDRYLVNKYEQLLHFIKSDSYVFNPDSLRLPKSIWAKKDKRKWKFNEKGALLGNVWEIPAVHLENPPHPARFPEKIVSLCIEGWSNKGDLVLDPFLGSGTTSFVAKRLCRKYIGIEVNKNYLNTAIKQLQGVSGNLFL